MNSRERVLKAIRFEGPDRIPIGYSVIAAALLKYGESLVGLCREFPNDFYDVEEVVKVPEKDTQNYRPDGTYYREVTDEWGSVWVMRKEGISGQVKKSPLDDWSRLNGYRFPPIPGSSAEERKKAREDMRRSKERYIGWGSAGSLFEQMQWLRGVEDLMMDIASGREEVHVLADMMLERRLLPAIELALEAGADVVGFSDDWGTQQSLLINPHSWREVFKPRYRRMFDLVHEGGALAWLHSDGMILEIIPDLMEIGLDVINPQFSCMDLEQMKKATHDRLCVFTDIDRQGLLQSAAPGEVRDYVRDVRDILASPRGGLIFNAGIDYGMPLENIRAVLSAFFEYRDL